MFKGVIKLLLTWLLLWLLLLVAAVGIAKAAQKPTPAHFLSKRVYSWLLTDPLFDHNKKKRPHLNSATCKSSVVRHIYICTFRAITSKGKKVCVRTFVHYDGIRFNPNKEVWANPWLCAQPTPQIPPFPGDPVTGRSISPGA